MENNFDKGKDYIINMIEEKTASVAAEAVFQNNTTDGKETIQKNNVFVNNYDENLASQLGEASLSINYKVKKQRVKKTFIYQLY